MNNAAVALPIILSTLVILILIAGVTIAFFISGRQQIRQQVILGETHLRYEKELRQVAAEISEDMMTQFSRELHDNIGQLLTCMRISIENKKLDEPMLTETFAPIEEYLDTASEQLRLLSRSLNSDYISHIGLVAAIETELLRIGRLQRQEVHYTRKGEQLNLDRNEQLMAFRIFQEMLQNTLRHSRARNLYVSLHTGAGFELEVTDDGMGFNLEEVQQSPKASGLRNMIKRAGMVAMECSIITAPGTGCRCVLRQKEALIQNNI